MRLNTDATHKLMLHSYEFWIEYVRTEPATTCSRTQAWPLFSNSTAEDLKLKISELADVWLIKAVCIF